MLHGRDGLAVGSVPQYRSVAGQTAKAEPTRFADLEVAQRLIEMRPTTIVDFFPLRKFWELRPLVSVEVLE